MKESKQKPAIKRIQEIPYIEKRNMQGYTLRVLTLEDGKVVKDEEVARDVPPIVYGKLLQIIKKQGFTGV